MSMVLDMLRSNINERIAKRFVLEDNQNITGTLTNRQGAIAGISLNNNGNQCFVGIGGTVDPSGNQNFTDVVNAWDAQNAGTGQVGTTVTIKKDRERNLWRVVSVDSRGISSTNTSVQYYNPNSLGSKFKESGFILDFLSRPVQRAEANLSTLVEVKPGIVYYAIGVMKKRFAYAGEQVDLAPFAATSGNHRIAQLWLDPETPAIQVTTSSDIPQATPFADAQWNETLVGVLDYWLPLQAYDLNSLSATDITQGNLLADNRPLYTAPFAAGGPGSGNVITKSNTIPAGKDAFFAGGLTITGGLTVDGELYILP